MTNQAQPVIFDNSEFFEYTAPDNLQFYTTTYSDPNAYTTNVGGYYSQNDANVYTPGYHQGGSTGSFWSAFGTGGFADEPPLLEELGINFVHIKMKSLAALNPLRTVDKNIMDDTDLAGPLLFCLVFGLSLLLTGKVHFGYIYGVAVLGWFSIYMILNLMSESGVDGYRTASVLGYCLLPLVLLSCVGVAVPLSGPLGLLASGAAIIWCTYSSSTMFVTVLQMSEQRLLVAYPVGLFMSETDLHQNKERIFHDIGEIVEHETDDTRPTEIESYCVNCEENGITKLLLTRIPHWRDIIVTSFECEHCGFSNNEVQFAGSYAEKGCVYTCKISTTEDLNRQLVKSENASIKFHELDLELPSSSKRGTLTTVEGLISAIIDDLSSGQPVRKHMDKVTYEKIEGIIEKLKGYKENAEEFTISIDDPSGNSYIENFNVPNLDTKLKIRHYPRTREMNIALGLINPDVEPVDAHNEITTDTKDDDDVIPDLMTFPGNCSECNMPGETRMQVLNIPHFKEVVIMSTTCDACGYKSNEVKAGGPISPKGKRIKLKVEELEDLSRDILKAETCGLTIPEIELDLLSGTLGGRFTTVEGLLRQAYEELESRIPFSSGDSVTEDRREKFKKFLSKLDRIIKGEILP
ncbi:921_t:CDS:10, partial [Paraglomus occultum]